MTERERRKLQHAKAILLGIKFRGKHIGEGTWSRRRWGFELPAHMQLDGRGWVSGFYKWRWEAVDAALRVIGVNSNGD